MIIFAVALGGLFGAPTRLLLDRAISDRVDSPFAIGTFCINVSGSLLLGFLSGLALNGHISPFVDALFGIGFCGAYTTFSTWSYEIVSLIRLGEMRMALATAFVSIAAGLLAAGAGLALGLAL